MLFDPHGHKVASNLVLGKSTAYPPSRITPKTAPNEILVLHRVEPHTQNRSCRKTRLDGDDYWRWGILAELFRYDLSTFLLGDFVTSNPPLYYHI